MIRSIVCLRHNFWLRSTHKRYRQWSKMFTASLFTVPLPPAQSSRREAEDRLFHGASSGCHRSCPHQHLARAGKETHPLQVSSESFQSGQEVMFISRGCPCTAPSNPCLCRSSRGAEIRRWSPVWVGANLCLFWHLFPRPNIPVLAQLSCPPPLW